MRLLTLALAAGLLLTLAPLVVAPTASACDPRVPTCGWDGECIFGYQPRCLIFDPCDPRSCDPWWP